MKKCVVIYNPNSGKGISNQKLIEMRKILEPLYDTTIIKSEYQGHTIKIVSELNYADLVISIGGDGTFNEAMNGNLIRQNKLLLAHIPVGTANDIGSMYGYKKNKIISNLKMLLKGEIKEVDLCTINDKLFTYSAGIGKFTNVSHQTPRRLKKKLGYIAYLIEGIKEFLDGDFSLYDLTYQIDDKVYNGKYSLILISNSNRIGGIKNFYKTIKLDDGEFEVLLCKVKDKRNLINSLVKLATKDATQIPGFEIHRTKQLKIWFKNEKEKIWTLDGELYKDVRNDYEIKIDQKVKVLVPSKNIKKLFKKS